MNELPTGTHQIAFLFLAFAHQTDGVFTREEQIMLWQRVHEWTEVSLTRGEFSQLMDEVMRFYKQQVSQGESLEKVIEVARDLDLLPSFDYKQRVQALLDLKMIAHADHIILREELDWIRTIGMLWHVRESDIKIICSRNSGLPGTDIP